MFVLGFSIIQSCFRLCVYIYLPVFIEPNSILSLKMIRVKKIQKKNKYEKIGSLSKSKIA